MAIVVEIGGVDRTSLIEKESFVIENYLTQEIDSCSLVIRNYASHTYKPSVGDEIEITDVATKIFGGVVIRVLRRMEGKEIVNEIECLDYARLADQELVAEVYQNETVNDIIADINSKYLSGFTVVNVDCSEVIDYIAFNYEPFSTCLKRLAEWVGYDWYVDYDKDIHFFERTKNPAPFDLTDTNGNYIFNSLVIKEDTSQLKNRIYVRGGDYEEGIPIIVAVQDTTSIATYGEYAFLITDKTIKTREGARERGEGELLTYKDPLVEGSFETIEKGLRSGQEINVQSTVRGLNKDFLIRKVSARMRTTDTMEYVIDLVMTKSTGIIDFFRGLVTGETNIADDEGIDKIWSGFVDEEIDIQEESYLWNTPVSPPFYVAGGVPTPVGVVGFCEAS